MKLFPFLKYKLTFENQSIADVEILIDKIIKQNSNRKYFGYILKEKRTFHISKNFGKADFIYCSGSYETSGTNTNIFIAIRPDTFSILLPLVSAGLAFWLANNFLGPLIIFLIVYSLVCFIPFNFVGVEMLQDLKSQLKPTFSLDITPQKYKL